MTHSRKIRLVRIAVVGVVVIGSVCVYTLFALNRPMVSDRPTIKEVYDADTYLRAYFERFVGTPLYGPSNPPGYLQLLDRASQIAVEYFYCEKEKGEKAPSLQYLVEQGYLRKVPTDPRSDLPLRLCWIEGAPHIWSPGPDRHYEPHPGLVYDPTNGIRSSGDFIWSFEDLERLLNAEGLSRALPSTAKGNNSAKTVYEDVLPK